MPHPSRRKKKGDYSKGELNRLIDSLLHPLFDRNPAFIIADTILHGMVEQDPSETVLKFIRYNLPKIIKEMRAQQFLGNTPNQSTRKRRKKPTLS